MHPEPVSVGPVRLRCFFDRNPTSFSKSLIEIFHYPIRSYRQLENKIAKGGAAYQINQELPARTGITWRKLFDELQRDANLNRYFGDNYYDERRLEEKMKSGEILEDNRLANYMRQKLFASSQESF